MAAESNTTSNKQQNKPKQKTIEPGTKEWFEEYGRKLKSSDKQVRKKAWRNLVISVVGIFCLGVFLFAMFYRPATNTSKPTSSTSSESSSKPKTEYRIAADKEEYEFTCTKIVDSSTSGYVHCETDGIVTGTYSPAEQQNLQPQYVTVENGKWSFSAESVSIMKSDVAPKSGFSDDKVPHSKQEIVNVRIRDGGKDVASTKVKIIFTFTDEVYAELLATNRQNAIAYAAAAPERERQQRITDLKACRIKTDNWTDAEAGEYADEYVKCRQKEYDQEKSTWENTAPSKVDTRSLCRTAGEAAAPYGIKFHNVVGVLSEEVQSAHERLYKVQVDVTNAFGATRETVMECKVSNDSGTNKVTYLNIY